MTTTPPDQIGQEVPFTEQLRSVPADFRASREIQWATDGTPTGHQFIPVGVMFHRAADEIERLRDSLSEGSSKLEAAQKDADHWRRMCGKARERVDDAEHALLAEAGVGVTADDILIVKAANAEFAQQVHELSAYAEECRTALRNLVAQVEKFAEEHGEADFYTGEAHAALAKTTRTEIGILPPCPCEVTGLNCTTAKACGANGACLRSDLDEAVSLLAVMYDGYEEGTACYENSDGEEGAFLGNAFKVSEADENRIIALLNRLATRDDDALPVLSQGTIKYPNVRRWDRLSDGRIVIEFTRPLTVEEAEAFPKALMAPYRTEEPTL